MQVNDDSIRFRKLIAGPITHGRISLCEDVDVSGLIDGDLTNANEASILATVEITSSGFKLKTRQGEK